MPQAFPSLRPALVPQEVPIPALGRNAFPSSTARPCAASVSRGLCTCNHLAYAARMPRAGSPYDWAYTRARARLLADHPRCKCGAMATTADHVPPISMHLHVRGSGCCVLVPACRPCQCRQGGEITASRTRSRETLVPQRFPVVPSWELPP